MKPDRHAVRALAAFYGVPRSAIRDPFPGKAPLPVDSIMEVLLERHRIGKPRTEHILMENWARIVGPVAAHRCSPSRIDSTGVLHTVVSNPILRRELNFQKAQILERIRNTRGCEQVRDVEFRAG